MDVFLAPNIERLLRNKVAQGIYNSLNEAINATLEIVLNGDCISQNELEQLNSDIQVGIKAADSGDLSDAKKFLKGLN